VLTSTRVISVSACSDTWSRRTLCRECTTSTRRRWEEGTSLSHATLTVAGSSPNDVVGTGSGQLDDRHASLAIDRSSTSLLYALLYALLCRSIKSPEPFSHHRLTWLFLQWTSELWKVARNLV